MKSEAQSNWFRLSLEARIEKMLWRIEIPLGGTANEGLIALDINL